MDPSSSEWLQRLQDGDLEAQRELFPILYAELRRIAGRQMRDERSAHTLQTTALVHEAWIKLAHQKDKGWEGRKHFLRVAARAMRSVLVDHARAKGTAKRGGGERSITWDDGGMSVGESDGSFVLDLHSSMERLSKLDEQLGQIAELRCFGGLTNQETANVIGVTERTIERGWRTARAWLQRDLGDDSLEEVRDPIDP